MIINLTLPTFGTVAGKVPAIGNTLGNSAMVFTDSQGKLNTSGTVTATEVSYLGGVTGNIQTQLNNASGTQFGIIPGKTVPIGSTLGATFINAQTIVQNENVTVQESSLVVSQLLDMLQQKKAEELFAELQSNFITNGCALYW